MKSKGSHKPDYIIALTIFGLLVVGLLVLSSASVQLSFDAYKINTYFFRRQLLYGGALGLVMWFITYRIDYKLWQKYAPALIGACILMLIAVFLPGIGASAGGAHRWINLGFAYFQPTELTKLALIFYLASWLDKRQKHMADFTSGLLPALIAVGFIALLIIIQPDIGTLFIITITAGVMFFAGGARLTHIMALVGGGVAVFIALIKAAPYRAARLTVFLNPSHDPKGIGYHVNQALLAIGSGGWWGRGYYNSLQKYNYLPEPIGDSIFAIMAEELGFIRILFIIGLFLLFAYRGFRVARNAPDMFGQLLAVGITSWLVFQTIINIGAMVSILPLTGVPLPFISYGSTSLAVTLASIGILMNISKNTREA